MISYIDVYPIRNYRHLNYSETNIHPLIIKSMTFPLVSIKYIITGILVTDSEIQS